MAKFKFFSVGGETDTDTNTNLANSNLTADNVLRSYNLASAGVLKFLADDDSGIITLDNDANSVSIGKSQPYSMPVSYSSAQYKSLVATNGSGGTDWQMQQFTNSFSVRGGISAIADRKVAVLLTEGGTITALNSTTAVSFLDASAFGTYNADVNCKIVGVQMRVAMTETTGTKMVFGVGIQSAVNVASLTYSNTTLGDIDYPLTTNYIGATSLTGLSVSISSGDQLCFYVKNDTSQTINLFFIWATIFIQKDVLY